jgi:hypothetical protein
MDLGNSMDKMTCLPISIAGDFQNFLEVTMYKIVAGLVMWARGVRLRCILLH